MPEYLLFLFCVAVSGGANVRETPIFSQIMPRFHEFKVFFKL